MSKLHISSRALRTPPSPIRKLAYLATQAKARGTSVFHLNIGQPDIKSPKEFFEGIALYQQEVVAYEQSQGNAELSNAWSAYMNRTLGLATVPEHFLITTGASEALIFVFMLCCDPGDEVLILDPTYANYIGFAAITGVKLIPVQTELEQNFALPSVEELERAITSRTRAVLICNPNNPTGTIYSKEELRSLIGLCNDHDLFLVVDETYREFTYDGALPLSALHLEPSNRRIIIVDSLSKRFSLCGARVGALITTNESILAGALNLAQARLASPTIEQFAAAHMLRKIDEEFINAVKAEYQGRRDTLLQSLKALPGVASHTPQGAFYTVARLPVKNAETFASFMLTSFSHNKKTTFVAPAEGFYMKPHEGENEIRLAYVLESSAIQQAITILGDGLKLYQSMH